MSKETTEAPNTGFHAAAAMEAGPWNIHVVLGSNVGVDVAKLNILKAEFKRGGRRGTGLKTLTLVVEYETTP